MLRRFENLIRARSGLNMRPQEAPLLSKTLAARMQAFRCTSPDQYLDLLTSPTSDAEDEWRHLFVLLTNQESYFFRDEGQLQTIRDHVLPALIQHNRHTRTLRIWSAGCSTGEEAYSLAMMLDELLPLGEEWRVLILGTDLSEKAVERARRSLYGSWSFRAFDKARQERFFVSRGNKWEVKPHLRRSVTFATGNLVKDEFPLRSGELHSMDLILCRNVFIYFEREAISHVLRKFSATLKPHGYLVTGHAELHEVALSELQARTFPQTVIYQRSNLIEGEGEPVVPANKPVPAPLNRAHLEVPPASADRKVFIAPAAIVPQEPSVTDSMHQATAMIRAGRYGEAFKILTPLLDREPRHLAALCMAAQAQANAGCLEEAEALCHRAIEVSPFASLPYHLLARIAEERGDSQTAKALLKKVIYLNPESLHSYLELGAIYTREGDAVRAAQMQQTVRRMLEGLPEDSLVPGDEYAVDEPILAGELKRHLQIDTGKSAPQPL